MARIQPEAAACNAAAPSDVRTLPDEYITGPFTDAKFEQFLDAHPGRRRDFMAESAREQDRYRARMARLWALRASPMPADLHAAVTLADQLQTALERIVATYAKDEARKVLAAAGVPIPSPSSPYSSWGADHFAHPYRFGRRLIRDLADYSEVVWAALWLMLPDGTEEPLTATEAADGARKAVAA